MFDYQHWCLTVTVTPPKIQVLPATTTRTNLKPFHSARIADTPTFGTCFPPTESCEHKRTSTQIIYISNHSTRGLPQCHSHKAMCLRRPAPQGREKEPARTQHVHKKHQNHSTALEANSVTSRLRHSAHKVWDTSQDEKTKQLQIHLNTQRQTKQKKVPMFNHFAFVIAQFQKQHNVERSCGWMRGMGSSCSVRAVVG